MISISILNHKKRANKKKESRKNEIQTEVNKIDWRKNRKLQQTYIT